MRQHNPNGSSRNCWATTREKARIHARFAIRQRVVGSIGSNGNGNSNKQVSDTTLQATTTTTTPSTDAFINNPHHLLLQQNKQPQQQQQQPQPQQLALLEEEQKHDLHEALRRIVDNDRAFFSLTKLEQNVQLYTWPFDVQGLLMYKKEESKNQQQQQHNKQQRPEDLLWLLMGQDKLLSWYGPQGLEQVRLTLDGLETMTLLEFALLFRRYDIVGSLLLGGINPCLRGTLIYDDFIHDDQDESKQRQQHHLTILDELGTRVLRKFFQQPIPLSLQIYILKRVFDFRYRIWTRRKNIQHYLVNPSSHIYHHENQEEKIEFQSSPMSSSSSFDGHDDDDDDICVLCQQTTIPMSFLLVLDTSCHHVICEVCFWKHLLETLDDQDGDVVSCPACTTTTTTKPVITSKTMNHSCNVQQDDANVSLLSSLSSTTCRFRQTQQKFFELPRDSLELKQQSKQPNYPKDDDNVVMKKNKKKKRPLFTSTWAEAVSLSLGNCQDVRRDKFFTYVERGAVHYVQGCLDAGIDLTAQNEYGQTGLYIASWRGHGHVVRLLLMYGSPHTIPANDGTLPIHAAQYNKNGHGEIVNLLEQYATMMSTMTMMTPSMANPSVITNPIPQSTFQDDNDKDNVNNKNNQNSKPNEDKHYYSPFCPSSELDDCRRSSLQVSTLIPSMPSILLSATMNEKCHHHHHHHPGAGSYLVDNVLTDCEWKQLWSLWRSLPTENCCSVNQNYSNKKKNNKLKAGGLCSVRSYYCDVDQFVTRILLGALQKLSLSLSSSPSSENQTCGGNDGDGNNRSNGDGAGTAAHGNSKVVLPFMRFLSYDTAGTRLAPHVDLSRVDFDSGRRSTHSFLLYLTDCNEGGETTLLRNLVGDRASCKHHQDNKHQVCNDHGGDDGNVIVRVRPKMGRLLLFPHACPHQGEAIVDVPKLLIRGEVVLGTTPAN